MTEREPSAVPSPDDSGDSSVRPFRPSSATREAERREADVEPGADRPPTAVEEEIAQGAPPVTEEQRAHAEEMLERGASQQGEGRIP